MRTSRLSGRMCGRKHEEEKLRVCMQLSATSDAKKRTQTRKKLGPLMVQETLLPSLDLMLKAVEVNRKQRRGRWDRGQDQDHSWLWTLCYGVQT